MAEWRVLARLYKGQQFIVEIEGQKLVIRWVKTLLHPEQVVVEGDIDIEE